MVFPGVLEVVSHQFQVTTLAYENILDSLYFLFDDLDIIKSRIGKHREFFAKPLISSVIKPLVLTAIAFEDAWQPWIDWSEVVFNVIIESGFEFVRIEHLNSTFLPSGSQRLTLTHIYLHMYHVMRKRLNSLIVIILRVKDNITWFEILFL
jgi:hypothetical protein